MRLEARTLKMVERVLIHQLSRASAMLLRVVRLDISQAVAAPCWVVGRRRWRRRLGPGLPALREAANLGLVALRLIFNRATTLSPATHVIDLAGCVAREFPRVWDQCRHTQFYES